MKNHAKTQASRETLWKAVGPDKRVMPPDDNEMTQVRCVIQVGESDGLFYVIICQPTGMTYNAKFDRKRDAEYHAKHLRDQLETVLFNVVRMLPHL